MASTTGSGSERPLYLAELSRDAQKQLYAANQLICKSYSSIEFNGNRGAKWHLFLDHEMDIVESCAIASAITVLRMTGERADSPLLQQAIATLSSLQQKNGGWTSWVTKMEEAVGGSTEEPLTLDTFYAVRALLVSEQAGSKNFQDGINWLTQTTCPEGGWGFYPDGKPCVLPTSYAIRILSKTNSIQPSASMKDTIDRGITWLLKAQSPEKGWGRIPGEESSSVHTALALMALADAGFNGLSPNMISGRNWLLDNHQDRSAIFDTYDVPRRDTKGKITGVLRTIKHLNFAEGLILQGLLAAETDFLDERFLKTVGNLISLHELNGHWKCLHAGFGQPMYAIMDACLALHRFVREIEDRRIFLELSAHIRTFQMKFAAVAKDFKRIEGNAEETNSSITRALNEVAQMGVSVQQLNTRLSNLDRLAERLDRIERGLWLLSPVTTASRFCAEYRLFSTVLFLLIVCGAASLIAWHYFGLKSRLFIVITFATNAVLLLINVISFFYQLYPRLHPKSKG